MAECRETHGQSEQSEQSGIHESCELHEHRRAGGHCEDWVEHRLSRGEGELVTRHVTGPAVVSQTPGDGSCGGGSVARSGLAVVVDHGWFDSETEWAVVHGVESGRVAPVPSSVCSKAPIVSQYSSALSPRNVSQRSLSSASSLVTVRHCRTAPSCIALSSFRSTSIRRAPCSGQNLSHSFSCLPLLSRHQQRPNGRQVAMMKHH